MNTITDVQIRDMGGPHSTPDDDRYAIVIRAGNATGVYGPVPLAPAAKIGGGLGAWVVGCRVSEHGSLQRQLTSGRRSDRLTRWAVGALDCALWDLRGRTAGLPVARLLSPTPAQDVRVYASWLSLDLAQPSAFDEVARVASDGFAFTKWAFRLHADLSSAANGQLASKAVHDTAAAAGRSVALDALNTWDDTATQVFASEVQPQAIRWLEDPCGRPSSLTATWLPLALGEHARSATGIRSLLNKQQLTALTIDVAWLGGISAALEALSFAQAAQVPVYPHGRAFLPGVHLAAAFPGLIPAVEYQVHWEPRRQELSRVPASPKGGHVLLPSGPGLGYPQEGR